MTTGSRPMFMHWKVPTRLIKDKPEYRAQQQSLIKDSHQHFYEDINGKRQFTNVENDVLKYTDEMYKNAGGWKEPTKHVRSSMTSTTHHSPPYHMFPQSRGKDYVSQSAVLPRGTVNPGKYQSTY
ncbi:uncharacterized protein LOC100367058 isoform X2 [Saccoglossus kowalevskii]|uniref:Uncharacterized protein LOC100367058 isoform X2 n=1 Tax=Saccoglossus kowalevskii TaxID=10224 RepID=A0ABM0M582_SACKO|nr:PREDICTED: uncharacterized protein LOC100367058 isoform X2 [Saccoglossus kowalevskii]